MNKKNILIHKKKTDYSNGHKSLEAKETLFQQLTLQEIIDELSLNNITVTLEDIKKNYDKYHYLQAVIDIFNNQYDNELDALGDKMELFDDDALYFLCNRYIKENYYPTQLFDPDYIEDLIDNYQQARKKEKPQLLLNIIHNVNGIAQYHKSKNLEDIFSGTFFDIENYIQDCTIEILNLSIPKEEALILINEFKQFIQTYNLNENTELHIYRDLIEKLARYGLSEVQELFEDVLKQYPNDKQSVYLSLLLGLEECKDLDNMKIYYQKAMQLMPISSLDIDNREILVDNFSYLKD